VHSKPWPWVFSVIGNVLLGIVGMIPFIFLVILVRSTVLTDLGWDDNAPALRDNTPIAATIGILGSALVLALFAGFNRIVTRKLTVPTRPYWVVSSVLLFVPIILAAVWPEFWQDLKPF
jgi:ABC-type uncharacterized transport system permease subunit